MSMHPDLHRWQTAKAAAFALASAAGLEIGQSPAGKPRLFRLGSAPQDYPTWLALWTVLHRIRADQLRGAT